jgi:hypothetical protein
MLAAFALRFPFEVFDGIRNVHFVARNAGFHQGFVEQSAGRPDEWMALQILLIAGLLADEDHLGVRGAFAEHRLCRAPIQIAPSAVFGGLA